MKVSIWRSPYMWLSWAFSLLEGWMLTPILWRHKWLYLLYWAYCIGLGYWSITIEYKQRRKTGYARFRAHAQKFIIKDGQIVEAPKE